jgi:hypothetical protein
MEVKLNTLLFSHHGIRAEIKISPVEDTIYFQTLSFWMESYSLKRKGPYLKLSNLAINTL